VRAKSSPPSGIGAADRRRSASRMSTAAGSLSRRRSSAGERIAAPSHPRRPGRNSRPSRSATPSIGTFFDGPCRMNGQPQDSRGLESPIIDLGHTGTTEIGATVSPPAEESGPVRPVEARVLGRYENLGEIARGGMGRVYRVRDLELD